MWILIMGIPYSVRTKHYRLTFGSDVPGFYKVVYAKLGNNHFGH